MTAVIAAWRKSRIKGWDARRRLKMKAQQPDGCEHFIKTCNAADRLLGDFYNSFFTSLTMCPSKRSIVR